MRLEKIKLAGFKSFVDPTTVTFPSNLVGVVGPNGCGKSNIIDAVRWVMGESSAKHLRGDSMADVIFNGSSARKPVGQATIELHFDNSAGKLGGQYAQYSEISIKRLVSRDGTSSYYLNGAHCRRRDIVDVFLGTGLGPRSYAIIEQGMISRLIEARPEDLRVFIEEAAGISKYKERRREAENRMRHTQDNLSRLNDLRGELDKQLGHLQRQADSAEKYKTLKEQERLLKAQLQALRWRILDAQYGNDERAIQEHETAYEKHMAELRHLEAEIEKQRELHIEKTDGFNEVQGRYYSVGADIARIEQNIQHTKDRRAQQQQDLQQAERALAQAQAHLDTDRCQIEEYEKILAQHAPLLEEALRAEQYSSAALGEAEQSMHAWQQAWDDFNRASADAAQGAEVERTHIQHADDRLLQLAQRGLRLKEEQGVLSPQALEDQRALLEAQRAELEEALAQVERQLKERQDGIATQRARNHDLSTQLDHTRSRLQQVRGRHAALEALQQAALGKRHGAATDWLQGKGLDNALRLAQGLEVESGWERAVECVLGFYLEAVCVNGIDPWAVQLHELQKGSLALFDMQAQISQAQHVLADPLLAKVRASWPMDSLLAGIYAAENLDAALALRPRLQAHESVITRDGLWMGGGWLRVARAADEKAGMLQREHELKELNTEHDQLEAQEAQLRAQLEQGRAALQRAEHEREALQTQANQTARRRADVLAEGSGLQARLEQIRTRATRIEEELRELQRRVAQDEEELSAARARLQEALDVMEGHTRRREQLTQQRDRLRAQVDSARNQARAERDTAQQLKLKVESARTALASTRQSLERIQSQLSQMNARCAELRHALTESEAPLQDMRTELATLLTQRVAVEQELTLARRGVDDIDHLLRDLSGQRNGAEHKAQEIRSELERARIGLQEIRVRRQTLEEQIAESQFTLAALFETLPEHAEVEQWGQNTERIGTQIQRLGAINLEAIDEYKESSERKAYLDTQYTDLTDALTTLENAIRKIDHETRERFKETFDRIDAGFKEKFPRLFGGGTAYLEMTGADLLDTGVTVMARPPGKRNSTIHLLSGGEKALTAVALVFAIFELNPAPFCMLDEVDAPLDEANVGRFCNLVREMSERVQFVFITHNKATMELANHLAGVTMHEPGVSRMVAVDVEEAVRLAAM